VPNSYAELMERNNALALRVQEAERWQIEVADGIGYVNRAEGQGGYEVAEPRVIIQAFRDLRSERDLAEDMIVRERRERQIVALTALTALRDTFAAAALTGLLSHPAYDLSPASAAEQAYAIADAMLAARAVVKP
jgi:hypothetical protein